MPLLSESPIVLPIHRKILAFSFIGWIFDFYDLEMDRYRQALRAWRERHPHPED